MLTDLVYSGGTSVQEYASSISQTNLQVEYIRGSDYGGGVGGILYTLRSSSGASTPSYTHANKRGDITGKADSSGNLTYVAQYQAFGDQVATYGTTLDRQKSNSKEQDPWGGHNEGMRYRDDFGFLTRDPAGMIDGPNEYCYVRQNPWSAFDAEGLLMTMAQVEGAIAESLPEAGGVAGSAPILPAVVIGGGAMVIAFTPELFPPPVSTEYAPAGSKPFTAPDGTRYTPILAPTGPPLGNALGPKPELGHYVTINTDKDSFDLSQALNARDPLEKARLLNAIQSRNAKAAGATSPGVQSAETIKFITYVLVDDKNNVRYVGRASGTGSADDVMEARIAKGHDKIKENPGLKPIVIGEQSNSDSNKGAEGIAYDYYKGIGANLLNDPQTPPISGKPSKTDRAQQKYQAFANDTQGSLNLVPNPTPAAK